MFEKITHFITTHSLIENNQKIVIGLSGGPDSIFLLHYLISLQKTYNLSFIIAHFNHEWRPEADQEQQMCQEIAHSLQIPFVTAKRSELIHNIKHNGSQEDYGRKMRRAFLENVLHTYKADTIALAHHAQDQKETFFIRLIRGASLSGLTSIKPKHGLYIRPLLETSKSDILAWLSDNNISYATDKSNDSLDYLRNCIRLKVLPALRACDKRFEKNFIATLNRLKETEFFLEQLTQQTFETISLIKDNQRILFINKFLATDKALHHRILLYWLICEKVPFSPAQSFLDEIIRFMQKAQGGTHAIHKNWSLIKKQKEIYIQKTT